MSCCTPKQTTTSCCAPKPAPVQTTCCTPQQTPTVACCAAPAPATAPSTLCCAPSTTTVSCCATNNDDNIKEVVQQKYAEMARFTATNNLAPWSQATAEVARSFGYSVEELAAIIPPEANLGLSCGNPIAIACLNPGDIVVDLGSGGGMDCFLAANKVGSSGKVIGIDMTPDMLELARNNAAKRQITNVQFLQGDIESLPLEDGCADVVISNCVINLVPNKEKAFSEIYRILKPGGRVAISDIALKHALPEDLKANINMYIGCIAGATSADYMQDVMKKAGFVDISIIDSGADLNAYKNLEKGVVGCCSAPSSLPALVTAWETLDVNEHAASVKVFARK